MQALSLLLSNLTPINLGIHEHARKKKLKVIEDYNSDDNRKDHKTLLYVCMQVFLRINVFTCFKDAMNVGRILDSYGTQVIHGKVCDIRFFVKSSSQKHIKMVLQADRGKKISQRVWHARVSVVSIHINYSEK